MTNYGAASGEVDVIENGAVAVLAQIDCTGVNCPVTSFVLRYSTDGTNFSLAIPASLGLDGVGMWVSPLPADLNDGTATCCISGALTPTHGVTSVTNAESATVDLAQNASITLRWIVRFGDIVNQSRWFKVYQANGAPLANGYTPSTGARVNIVPTRTGTGF